MPVPKRKVSKSRRDKRSANKHVTASSFADCKNCGQVALPHQVCNNCGFYKGQKVIETKLDRAMRRGAKAKRAQTTEPTSVGVAVEPEDQTATKSKKVAKKTEEK